MCRVKVTFNSIVSTKVESQVHVYPCHGGIVSMKPHVSVDLASRDFFFCSGGNELVSRLSRCQVVRLKKK